jgi:hypothetical protein
MPTTTSKLTAASQVEAAADARAQAGPPRRVIIAGSAFVQNLRRGHYELAVEEPVNRRGGRVRPAGLGDLTLERGRSFSVP